MRIIRLLAWSLVAVLTVTAAPPIPKKPKLVVAVFIDQFRYDYLTRFRADYKDGLARLLANGAVFTNATYEHFPTVTAIGHSTLLSGATPSLSGIVGNEWYDRDTRKAVTSVSDSNTQLLGGEGRGSSPHRLLVSTLGDELKMVNGANSKVVGISSKDRSAILPGGRMANGAYWFDTGTGNFVSSTYYFPQLPEWADRFNKARYSEKFLGTDWLPFDSKPGTKPFRKLGPKADREYFDALERTPFSNLLIEEFAEAAIEGEQLGTDDAIDVLSVSFSANDRIGHALGPDAPEIRDVSIQTDRILGKLLKYLDDKVGANQYLVVLTADHGVAPLPEVMQKRHMPGGRISELQVLTAIQNALVEKYGNEQWVVGKSGPAPYFDYDLIAKKKLSIDEMESVAAAAARALPHIARVYTRSQLARGLVLNDMVDRRVSAGFHRARGSDLFIVPEPYYLFEEHGTSHGTPYNYDAHVPVIFMGPGVKSGRYHFKIAVNDVAPTLSTLLEVETPSGSVGRVLNEIIESGY